MPMLEHAPGREPQGIGAVGAFGRRFVGQRKDARLAIGEAVELAAPAGRDVRMGVLGGAPACFLAIDRRRAQAAGAVVSVERRQIVTMAAAERCVLLKQTLLYVKAEMVCLGIVIAGFDICQRILVDLAVFEQ